MSPGVSVDIAKTGFRRKIVAARPRAEPNLHRLGVLAAEIDPLRQAAQHREGVPVLHGMLRDQGRWYLPIADPRRLRFTRERNRHDVGLQLNRWADSIEKDVCRLLML